eukprot:TRINITY_DN318_c1_g2_i1.p1 TRINITY_DN318_c1_g2~~TRINITY_DN318_c1_g2_i1.p1  ORF type:complete len:373 (-),score=87.67 TRINITY_DN318_c1_g2_i1:156-1274(-)
MEDQALFRYILFLCIFIVSTYSQACSWTYKDDWATLPCVNICSGGPNNEQSPVDILSEFQDSNLSPLTFSGYINTYAEIVNTGETIRVELPSNYTGTFDGRYVLKQFHFHTPTEEHFSLLDRNVYDMSMHMVHVDQTKRISVVAFVFQKGEDESSTNEWLEQFMDDLNNILDPNDSKAETYVAGLDKFFSELSEEKKDGYWHLSGSLTTPPCTEGVSWFIMHQPLQMSPSQYDKLHKMMGNNVRGVQRNLTHVSSYFPSGGAFYRCLKGECCHNRRLIPSGEACTLVNGDPGHCNGISPSCQADVDSNGGDGSSSSFDSGLLPAVGVFLGLIAITCLIMIVFLYRKQKSKRESSSSSSSSLSQFAELETNDV